MSAFKIEGDVVIDDSNIALKDLLINGSNSNGKYIKFGDGTLICYGEGSFTTATGGVGFYEAGVSFPVEFVDTNYAITITEIDAWATGKIATIGKAWSSKTRATLFSQSPSWSFCYIAIGKWK